MGILLTVGQNTQLRLLEEDGKTPEGKQGRKGGLRVTFNFKAVDFVVVRSRRDVVSDLSHLT